MNFQFDTSATSKSNPCYKCTKRHIGCHSTCEGYKKYAEKTKKLNEDVKKRRAYYKETCVNWSYIKSKR